MVGIRILGSAGSCRVARRVLQQLHRDVEGIGLRKFTEAALRDDGLRPARPAGSALF